MAPKEIQALLATESEDGKSGAAGRDPTAACSDGEKEPSLGQERIAAELWLKLGVEVLPRTLQRPLAPRVRSERWEEDRLTALADIYTKSVNQC